MFASAGYNMSCCSCCSRSCCGEEGDDGDKEVQEIVLPEFHKVPLEKVFQFAQPQVPLSIHPQIRKKSVITQQPTAFLPGTKLSKSEESSFSYSTFSASLKNYPKINFSIIYDIQTSSLIVHLESAENLIIGKKDAFEAFVILFLLPHREDIFRSKSMVYCQTIIDETFSFPNILYNEVSERTLVLRVQSQNHVIGNVILPLHKTELHGVRVSAVLSEDTDTEEASIKMHANS